MTLFAVLLRLIFGTSGLLLIYLGFTYETEQDRIENYFQSLWIKVDDLRASGMTAQLAFLRVVSQAISGWLELLFGPKLVSKQAILASIGLTSATTSFAIAILGDSSILRISSGLLLCLLIVFLYVRVRQPKYILLLSSVLVGLSILGVFFFNLLIDFAPCMTFIWFTLLAARRPERLNLFLTIVLALVLWMILNYTAESLSGLDDARRGTVVFVGDFFLVLSLSFTCDIAFIASFRKILRRISTRESALAALALLATSFALVAIFIVVIPVGLSFASESVGDYLFKKESIFIFMFLRDRRDTLFGDTGNGVLLTNLWEGLVGLLFLVLALFMCLHRALWRLVSRPLYAIASERILEHRWSMITAGVTCLTVASAWIESILIWSQALMKPK
jgi:hypothetical protein